MKLGMRPYEDLTMLNLVADWCTAL